MKIHHLIAATLAGSLASIAHADVRLAKIFGDNMVVQHGTDVRIWGWAGAGETVGVTLGNQLLDVPVISKPDGSWVATIPAQKPGPVDDIKIKGKNEIVLKNVLAGDVWVCSGQSNMEFRLKSSLGAQRDIDSANLPEVRLITISNRVEKEPKSDIADGKWTTSSPQTAAEFSAVAFYFGREINSKAKVPIGLISASAGWTPAEAWMSREGLSADAEIKRDVLDRWDHMDKQAPIAAATHAKNLAAWQVEADKAKAAGKEPPPQPAGPFDPGFMHRPSGFWNGDIAPITQLSIKGVIWYQGETNVQRAEQYRRLFPALINDWRRAFGKNDLPFLFVEIAPVGVPATQPGGSQWHKVGISPWAELRESQHETLKMPNVYMAQTLDQGYTLDVHPTNKRDVGIRLANAALTHVYNQPTQYSGPTYKSSTIEGDKVRITFDNIGEGLHLRGGGAEGFAIAGEDQQWFWGTATLDGNDIIVRSDKVKEPKAVRYAWSDYAVANLFGSNDLPARAFRTDDWPLYTKGSIILTPEEMGVDLQTLFPKAK